MKTFKTFRPQKRRRGPLPFRYVLLISIIIFSFLTVQGLVIVEKGIRPTLVDIAKTQTQKIGTLAINDAMSKKVLQDMQMEDVVDIQYDNNGKIQTWSLNQVVYHQIQHETVRRVQDYLNDIEHGRIKDYSLPTDVDIEREGATFADGGIIHTIPLGQATNNALLAHLGPRVPVRFSAIGDVKADIKEEVLNVGINNTYISISVDIAVDVRIVIPFSTDQAVVSTSIPVAVVWISGDVPQFYSVGGEGVTPSFNVPDQQEGSNQNNIQGFGEFGGTGGNN